MRKEFISNVSHELKTPIALIQGYAEGLQESISDNPEDMDYYCDVIIDEAGKMNKMVKNLLTLNQLEFGNGSVNMERFDITSVIAGVIHSMQIKANEKQVNIEFNQMEPTYVWADEFQIEEVITNYLSNALNHVDENRIIQVKIQEKNGIVRVSVFNTGKNIPENELDNIWIKFYKVDKARTRAYGGNGIGLSIVKAIMDRHEKKCGAINRPDGVEFWFELDCNSLEKGTE
jgi:two-component system sensor histidine kinase VanS